MNQVRARLHEATLACAARSSLRFTVDDVAAEAGVSRATLYRHFPGGREQLIHDGLEWEIARFFGALSELVLATPAIEDRFVLAILHGRRLLADHAVLERLLTDDRAEFVVELESVIQPVFEALEAALVDLLREAEFSPAVPTEKVAAHVARLYLSYLGHSGSWDLDDPDEVRRLVRTQFLAGF